MRCLSKVAPLWWDYTTLDEELLHDAAKITVDNLAGLARPGFRISFYDSREARGRLSTGLSTILQNVRDSIRIILQPLKNTESRVPGLLNFIP